MTFSENKRWQAHFVVAMWLIYIAGVLGSVCEVILNKTAFCITIPFVVFLQAIFLKDVEGKRFLRPENMPRFDRLSLIPIRPDRVSSKLWR